MATKELRQALRDFAPGFTQAEIRNMTDADLVANLHDQYKEMEGEEAAALWSILSHYCYNCGREHVAPHEFLAPHQPLCQPCVDGA